MGFYDNRILPHLIDQTCSMAQIMKLRSEVVPECSGVVLEVGLGSGINLPFYDPAKVSLVYGLEPSEGMRRKAQTNLSNSPVPVEWLDLPCEGVPLPDNSVDTVLLTFALCTIPDWRTALAQMARVLRPGGKLLFLEHGQAPDAGVRKWQNRLTPAWKKVAGGCHLNRPILDYIREAGFEVTTVEKLYVPKTPRVAGYVYKGRAVWPNAESAA